VNKPDRRAPHKVLSVAAFLAGALLCNGFAVAGEQGVADMDLSTVRRIDRNTALAAGGRPAALLLPVDEAYRPAARLLSEGLAKEGVASQPVTGIAEADPASRTVICIGSMVNNPLIERLYWNRYTFVDALTPSSPAGPAGQYLLQVVYDPYPFGGGNNVIVVGCHDPQGAERGIRRLLAIIKDGKVPYVLETGPRAALTSGEASAVGRAAPDPTLTELADNVERYLKTGYVAYARQAVAALARVGKLYAPDGERRAANATYYARLPWNEEIRSWEIACAWDALEEFPELTDAQRLACSNVLLHFTRGLVSHVSEYDRLGQGDTISWNHTTFPLLGINFGARYFDRYYHLADMPGMLAKARSAFLGQARSWKPREDADTYMSYTMLHTAIYCLAEHQMAYLQGGNLQRFADYIVGICDNSGRTSGFGDSNSLATDPRLAETVVPLALWWTKDGAYRWLMDRYTDGAWRNPYERGVTAVRPDRLAGVRPFYLDPQLYDFTQTRPFYSEPVIRADVPPSEAFDKIAFRQNWDRAGQYLLMDGFARGKHLHYDGNSIVELVEGGERWLIDHDYYSQNTTEHTMLSILRDGRCAEMEPSMSGLAACADGANWGFARTYVRGYNGCDWQRRIVWRKGGWFLVADQVTPRAAGEYAFDLTWKTIDSGDQSLSPRGAFRTERGRLAEVSRNCSLVEDPLAQGGTALQLENLTSQAAFGLNLPPGEYTLRVVGDGADLNSGNLHGDCLRVSVDGGPTVWVRFNQQDAATAPRITLQGRGPHTVIAATSNVHAPMRVDRFVFTDDAGRAHSVPGTRLPPVPTPDSGQVRQFWIKPAVMRDTWITQHHPEGIAVPVAILHQRAAGRFAAGESVRFASLIYTSLPAVRRQVEPTQIAQNLLVVAGSDPGIVLLGDVDTAQVKAKADAGLVTADSASFSGLRHYQAGDMFLESSAPVTIELDFAGGRATADAAVETEIRSQIGGRLETHRVPPGHSEWKTAKADRSGPAATLIHSLLGSAPRSSPVAPIQPAGNLPAGQLLLPEGPKVEFMDTADLGDGQGPVLLVGRGTTLECISPRTGRQWTFRLAGRPTQVSSGDLGRADGARLLVSSSDTFIYVLSAAGKLIEKRRMHGAPWNRNFGDLPYSVDGVGIFRLKPGSPPVIAAVLGNSELQVFDSHWHPQWTVKDFTMQGATQLASEGGLAPGGEKLIVAADKYGYCEAVDGSGREVYRGRSSIGNAAYVVLPARNGREAMVVTGSSGGDLMATGSSGWWGAAGGVDMSQTTLKPHRDVLWRFDNYGYAITRLKSCEPLAAGGAEVLLASASGYFYALDRDGRLVWKDRTGRGVNDVTVLRMPSGARAVAYCDEAGLIRLADRSGNRIADFHAPSPPRLLATVARGTFDLLAVALADGRVLLYRVDK
jgi:hypothetical protein